MESKSQNSLSLTVLLVVPEPQVVPDGVREVGGQDVGLEDVDVDGDAHGLPGADGADGGDGGTAVVVALPTGNSRWDGQNALLESELAHNQSSSLDIFTFPKL